TSNRRPARLSLPFFFSSRRRHTRSLRDWSSDVCSSDLRSFSRIRCMCVLIMKCCHTKSTESKKIKLRLVRPNQRPRLVRRIVNRSEERRVGKECRSRRTRKQQKKKTKRTITTTA